MKTLLKFIMIFLVLFISAYVTIFSNVYGNYRKPLRIDNKSGFDLNVKIKYEIPWWFWDKELESKIVNDIPQEIPEEFEYKLKKFYVIIPEDGSHKEYEINIIPEGYQDGDALVEFVYNQTNGKPLYLICKIGEYNETDGIRAVQMESTDVKILNN